MSSTQSTSRTSLDLEALARRSWRLFAADPIVHLGACAVVLVGSAVSLSLLSGPLVAGYIRLVAKAERGEPVDITDVSSGFERFAPPFFTWAVYAVGVTIGLALFVLPGVLLAVAWAFALWFVALRGELAAPALKRSWALTRREPSNVLLVALLVVLASFIGSLFVIGVFFTAPLSFIFMTFAFQELEARGSGTS